MSFMRTRPKLLLKVEEALVLQQLECDDVADCVFEEALRCWSEQKMLRRKALAETLGPRL